MGDLTYLSHFLLRYLYFYSSMTMGYFLHHCVKPLKSLYKGVLKILDKKTRHYYHCNIITKFNLFCFYNLILFSDISLVYNITHNLTLPPLRVFVNLGSDQNSRVTITSTRGDCSLPKRSTTFPQSTFSFKAAKKWNGLPSALKTCSSIQAFLTEIVFCLFIKSNQS